MSPINTSIAISVVIAAASLIRNFSSPSDNNTFSYYHHCTQPNYFRGSSFFSKYLPGSSYEKMKKSNYSFFIKKVTAV
ncbi:unnamed protein product [Brassica oleracea]|uniref:(rape) hypothetical protein n=1 Tax=Brassica napus TaxID=3708 RepID=A0A816KXN2_BRANA|nr:unnamed protein product [Brassica napus]